MIAIIQAYLSLYLYLISLVVRTHGRTYTLAKGTHAYTSVHTHTCANAGLVKSNWDSLFDDVQCSAQVFKRAGCHLKRAHLAR